MTQREMQRNPEHTNRAFDVDIDGMRSAVITMGGLVEKQFVRAVDSIRDGDLRLISQVLTDETQVNDLHLSADMLCNQILARRQPFAVDLREVMAAVHTINDLERIGDESKKIALKARDMESSAKRLGLSIEKIDTMSGIVREMLEAALDAFVHHDSAVAPILNRKDSEVDALRDSLRADLLAAMARDAETISAALDLIFIVQSIERIGDHAKNISEYVFNVVEGVDMRHAKPATAAAG